MSVRPRKRRAAGRTSVFRARAPALPDVSRCGRRAGPDVWVGRGWSVRLCQVLAIACLVEMSYVSGDATAVLATAATLQSYIAQEAQRGDSGSFLAGSQTGETESERQEEAPLGGLASVTSETELAWLAERLDIYLPSLPRLSTRRGRWVRPGAAADDSPLPAPPVLPCAALRRLDRAQLVITTSGKGAAFAGLGSGTEFVSGSSLARLGSTPSAAVGFRTLIDVLNLRDDLIRQAHAQEEERRRRAYTDGRDFVSNPEEDDFDSTLATGRIGSSFSLPVAELFNRLRLPFDQESVHVEVRRVRERARERTCAVLGCVRC